MHLLSLRRVNAYEPLPPISQGCSCDPYLSYAGA